LKKLGTFEKIGGKLGTFEKLSSKLPSFPPKVSKLPSFVFANLSVLAPEVFSPPTPHDVHHTLIE
jgi:hypothetical protein